MPCLKAPHLALPDISLLLPSLDIEIGPPSIGLSLCCKIPIPPIPLPIISIGTLPIPDLSTILQPAIALIMAAVDTLNGLLDQIQVSCPYDD